MASTTIQTTHAANPAEAETPKVYIIHENGDWLATLRATLTEAGIPFEEWDVGASHGVLDMTRAPPQGVFYNIVSPSSHKRGHRFAMEMGGAVVAWLEHHGRRVVNGSKALEMELSKVKQDLILDRFGIAKPDTVACIGPEAIIAAIQRFRSSEEGVEDAPFLLKHNRGGSGIGVRLFRSVASAEAYVNGPEFLDSVDGVTLLQTFVDSPENALYRLEFVNSKLMYSVRVDTTAAVSSRGPINNCPADSCNRKGGPAKHTAVADEEAAKTPETMTEEDEAAIGEVEDEEEFDELVAANDAAGKLSVVYFGASWCKNCRTLKPAVKQLAAEFSEQAVFVAADVDEANDLAERLDVTNIPHVALVRDGEVVATHTGADAALLKAKLDSAVGNTSEEESSSDEEETADTGNAMGYCSTKGGDADKFRIIKDFQHPVVEKLERMARSFDSGVAGFEIIIDAENEAYVIDLNCINTNYNTAAEARAGLGAGYGIMRVRELLIGELRRHYPATYSATEDGHHEIAIRAEESANPASDSDEADDDSSSGSSDDSEDSDSSEDEEVTLTLSPLIDTSELMDKMRQLQAKTSSAKTDISPERTPYQQAIASPTHRPTNFWLDSQSVY